MTIRADSIIIMHMETKKYSDIFPGYALKPKGTKVVKVEAIVDGWANTFQCVVKDKATLPILAEQFLKGKPVTEITL